MKKDSFTGKERDTESGNDYFGARYYASTMGRFMSPDWASNLQAVPFASYANPQSLNLYNYMHNNPLSGVAADGHLPGGFAGPIIITPQQAYDVAVGALKGFGRLVFSAFSMTDNRITNPAYAHMQDMPVSLQYSNTTQAVGGWPTLLFFFQLTTEWVPYPLRCLRRVGLMNLSQGVRAATPSNAIRSRRRLSRRLGNDGNSTRANLRAWSLAHAELDCDACT